MLDNSLFRQLLDRVHEGVYFVDRERRIQYWNKSAERITGYSSDRTVGCRCADNLLVHTDENGTPLCLNGCPLAATLADGRERHSRVFLRHQDGYRLPVQVSVSAVHDEAGVLIGGMETFHDDTRQMSALQQLQDLQQTALICPVTGIPNRAHMETTLKGKLRELEEGKLRFALAFLDVDHFKQVNDRYGHEVGDVVLKMVARTLASALRSYDVFGRWGGEEFLLILPGLKPIELEDTTNRLRALVEESSRALSGDRICVTVSIGACMAQVGDSVSALVARADKLMYRSKANGRNCVTVDTWAGSSAVQKSLSSSA